MSIRVSKEKLMRGGRFEGAVFIPSADSRRISLSHCKRKRTKMRKGRIKMKCRKSAKLEHFLILASASWDEELEENQTSGYDSTMVSVTERTVCQRQYEKLY